MSSYFLDTNGLIKRYVAGPRLSAEELTSAFLLDNRLRAAFERLEALPQNQSGADKSWVESLAEETRALYRDAVRIG